VEQRLPLNGVDRLLHDEGMLTRLSRQSVLLLTNQSALTQDYRPSAKALQQKIGGALKGILAPEHGWSGLLPEGEGGSDGWDAALGLPIWSLYGQKRTPFPSVDVIVIDLQDVGLRCYTYAATCAQMMEALGGNDTEIIVCDRPNPLGPRKAGPKLDPAFRSIVGYLDVSWQHGQTLGQLLSAFNESLGVPLTVMPCQPFYEPYNSPWIPPSPNLPSWEAVLLYPALVMLEGTNVSEGRGTTLPFTSLGAPGLPHEGLIAFLKSHPGVHARPLTFTPTRSKWAGQECQGVHFLVTDVQALQSYELGLDILRFLYRHYEAFEWIPGASYFIDSLMGTDAVRKEIEGGEKKVSPS